MDLLNVQRRGGPAFVGYKMRRGRGPKEKIAVGIDNSNNTSKRTSKDGSSAFSIKYLSKGIQEASFEPRKRDLQTLYISYPDALGDGHSIYLVDGFGDEAFDEEEV